MGAEVQYSDAQQEAVRKALAANEECDGTCEVRDLVRRFCVNGHRLPQHDKNEVRVTDARTGGEKGQKRSQLGAVDPAALMRVAEVAGFGSEKYERYNFAKGYAWSLSYDAMQRHLHAFWGGELLDPESGLPHLAHAGWHCLTLLTFSERERGTDDRFPITAVPPSKGPL